LGLVVIVGGLIAIGVLASLILPNLPQIPLPVAGSALGVMAIVLIVGFVVGGWSRH
jgi:hypothetical protein